MLVCLTPNYKAHCDSLDMHCAVESSSLKGFSKHLGSRNALFQYSLWYWLVSCQLGKSQSHLGEENFS